MGHSLVVSLSHAFEMLCTALLASFAHVRSLAPTQDHGMLELMSHSQMILDHSARRSGIELRQARKQRRLFRSA